MLVTVVAYMSVSDRNSEMSHILKLWLQRITIGLIDKIATMVTETAVAIFKD